MNIPWSLFVDNTGNFPEQRVADFLFRWHRAHASFFNATGHSGSSSSDRFHAMRSARLLDDIDAPERLTKAEVLRELGEYTEAVHLLVAQYPTELLGAKALIKSLEGIQLWMSFTQRMYGPCPSSLIA